MSAFPTIKIYPPGHYVEVDGDALFLGRDCHLAPLIPCLMNKVVSNRHCVIRREGPERWMLEDLGSTNGTWVRGNRLAGKTLLHTGDEFRLGSKGPLIECAAGFGGTGPDRTIPEEDLPEIEKADAAAKARAKAAAAAAPTLVEPPPPPRASAPQPVAATALPVGKAGPGGKSPEVSDGSALHPFRVGKPPSLILVHQRTGEKLTAAGYTIVIGRDPAVAQILIRAEDEKHVSGRHVEIQFRTDGTVVVRDLGSRNGSWLNDKPLKGDSPLKVGDRLLLGNAPTSLVVAALDL